MSFQPADSRSTPFVIAVRPRTPAKVSGTAHLSKSGKLKPDSPRKIHAAGVTAGDTAKVWQPGTGQPAYFRRVLAVNGDDSMTIEPAGFTGSCRFRVPVEWPPSGPRMYIQPLDQPPPPITFNHARRTASVSGRQIAVAGIQFDVLAACAQAGEPGAAYSDLMGILNSLSYESSLSGSAPEILRTTVGRINKALKQAAAGWKVQGDRRTSRYKLSRNCSQ